MADEEKDMSRFKMKQDALTAPIKPTVLKHKVPFGESTEPQRDTQEFRVCVCVL